MERTKIAAFKRKFWSPTLYPVTVNMVIVLEIMFHVTVITRESLKSTHSKPSAGFGPKLHEMDSVKYRM